MTIRDLLAEVVAGRMTPDEVIAQGSSEWLYYDPAGELTAAEYDVLIPIMGAIRARVATANAARPRVPAAEILRIQEEQDHDDDRY